MLAHHSFLSLPFFPSHSIDSIQSILPSLSLVLLYLPSLLSCIVSIICCHFCILPFQAHNCKQYVQLLLVVPQSFKFCVCISQSVRIAIVAILVSSLQMFWSSALPCLPLPNVFTLSISFSLDFFPFSRACLHSLHDIYSTFNKLKTSWCLTMFVEVVWCCIKTKPGKKQWP